MLEPGKINVVSASEVHFQLFLLLPTFAYDNAFRGVRAEAVGGDALVLAGVGRHRVHDLDRDDAVRVRDRVLVRLKLLSALEPFDLRETTSSD